MGRTITPPKFAQIPAAIIFDAELSPALRDTWIQLYSLAWSNGYVNTPSLTMQEFSALISKPIKTIYGHIATLRDRDALRWITAHGGRVTFMFDGHVYTKQKDANSDNSECLINVNSLNSLKIDNLDGRDNLKINTSTAQGSEKSESGDGSSENSEHTTLDASRAFCEATGLMVMPANDRRVHDIEAIQAMLEEFGKAETVEKLRAAFAAWKACKRKDNGIGYSSLNTAWIDYAMAGELPGRIALDAPAIIQNDDGSLNV